MQRDCAFLIILLIALTSLGPQAFAQNDSSASYLMAGNAELLSHYVEHGVSQTDKSPSLQASFMFNVGPQVQIGLWGSNVSYENEEANFVLKPNLNIKMSLSTNTILTVSYGQRIYFNTSDRNGNVTALNFNASSFIVKYELISNWEGTNKKSTYFALGKVFDYSTWKWENELGYSMLKKQGYNNYFDISSFIGRDFGKIYGRVGMTGTSANSQFGSAGGYFFIVKLYTGF